MARTRTNSLHQRVPLEVREAVQRDLVEQPPGRATYRQVYDHYELRKFGVSVKAVEHWGAYLRDLARSAEIHRLVVNLHGKGLNASIEDTLSTLIAQASAAGELSVDELRKLVGSLRELAQAKSLRMELEERQRAMTQAIDKAEKSEDPGKALADVIATAREVYGLEPKPE